MKNLFLSLIFMLPLLFVGTAGMAQEENLGYNPHSLRPVHEDYQMFKKRLWRMMDLKEKQNKPFFAVNSEISKILIEAVKAGVLQPYTNDSLTTRMTKETFLENLLPPDARGADETVDDGWGAPAADDWGGGGSATPINYEYLPRQISWIEITEDVFFDKIRSRMYYDIISLTLILPPTESVTGLQTPIATFRYKDLVELWRSMPKEAIWFNPQNNAENRNMADAFDLRLFSSRLTKVSNPDNLYIEDIYGDSRKQAIMAQQWEEHKLMEFEHELWSY